MDIEYHPLFSLDLVEAASFLERQEVGLGRRFIDLVETACRKAQADPQQFRYIENPVRRVLVKPFKYAVHFEQVDEKLYFYGVFHQAMNPTRWAQRRND